MDKEFVVHIQKGILLNHKKEHISVSSNEVDEPAAAAKSLQLCPTLQPHRRQPTRFHRPRDSPGKNTGVGCHFFLQCMKVKSESEVTESCPTLSDPIDCSLPGSSIHCIFQARVLEWGDIEPIIQSEVCQKEKGKYRILTHTY